jgi:signal transduction histidine kinase
VEKSLQIVHQFARELRPASLDDLGLIPALHTYIKDFPKRRGRRIQFAAFAGVEAMDNDKRTVLYRVAQEALTNVAKHAQASVVRVAIIKAPAGVCLEIADNGKAFNVDRVVSGQGGQRLGLIGMRERVEMVGGRFSVVSGPGKGTTIRAEIPFGKINLR